MKYSEHSEQVLLINWVRAQQKADPRLALLFAIPNGGARNAATGRRLKAEGVLAGVPDLFLPVPSRNFHGLFIELKTADGGRASPAQKAVISKLLGQGYKAEVCHGHQSAIKTIEEYLNGYP